MNRRMLASGMVVFGLAATLAGGVALAREITCTGEVGPPNVDAPTCRGTGKADVITGSPHRDNVVAGGGDDEVTGEAGNDFIIGNKGDDTLDGGTNNDWLEGDSGADQIIGGGGSDVVLDFGQDGAADGLDGGDGDDWLEDGGGGDDTLHGGPGNNKMFGGEGDDTIEGGAGGDYMEGEQGNDTLNGGAGDDYIDAAADETPDSQDKVDCGGGVDEVVANESDDVVNCEHVTEVDDPTSVASAKQRRAGSAEQARERERFLSRREAGR